MGYIRAKAKITNPNRTRSGEPTFLVDSGSWYTVITPQLGQEVGLTPTMKTKLTLADKREVETDLAPAYVEIQDREIATLVAILDVPEPLVGVETLEALGLKPNPTTGQLESTRPYAILLV